MFLKPFNFRCHYFTYLEISFNPLSETLKFVLHVYIANLDPDVKYTIIRHENI